MTPQQLLGPCALGQQLGVASLKQQPQDFQVDEQLEIELSGQGEHLWLWIEKSGLNTEQVAQRLAKAAGIPLRQIGYAGLKDRQALTRQWFSLHLAGKDFAPEVVQNEQLHVLRQQRHSRKLQRGAHRGNQFFIRLRDVQAEPSQLEQRLQLLSTQAVPNYFGPQRFGFGGNNLQQALEYAAAGRLPQRRNQRSRLLSSARSYLFNQVLAARVADGSWQQMLDGEVLGFANSRSTFVARPEDAQDPRFARLDLHPTAPLWGAGPLATTGAAAALEQALAGQHQQLCRWLADAGLKQERRVARLVPQGLKWCHRAENILELRFALPVGCFATVVLRELLAVEDVNIPCEF